MPKKQIAYLRRQLNNFNITPPVNDAFQSYQWPRGESLSVIVTNCFRRACHRQQSNGAVVCRFDMRASVVSGLTHGVHAMTENLALSSKTTLVCPSTPYGGCEPSTLPSKTLATLLEHRWTVMRWLCWPRSQRVGSWQLRRVTRSSCTSVSEPGACLPRLSIGGDSRLVATLSPTHRSLNGIL